MTDTTSTDLGPFFNRHDRRNRLVLATAALASLGLSALIATHLLGAGGAGAKPVMREIIVWGAVVVVPPLFIGAWWAFGESIALGRRRILQPDGSLPASADDARDGVRIANAGFAFNLAVVASVITTQALTALVLFGYPVRGDLILRAVTAAVGVVTIYLGNFWPRMPTPRRPEQKAAMRMKANRFSGWLMVIVGLLVVLFGLFLPLIYPWVSRRP